MPRLQEELHVLQSKLQLSEVQARGHLHAENQAGRRVWVLTTCHRSHVWGLEPFLAFGFPCKIPTGGKRLTVDLYFPGKLRGSDID